jgi:hypothetical protein
MVRLPVIAAALILPGLALAQPADDAAKCHAAAGSYLTGTVVSGPRFKPGERLHGTYLSHTHLTLRGDADGRAYDVAIDNRGGPRVRRLAAGGGSLGKYREFCSQGLLRPARGSKFGSNLNAL